MLWEVETEGSSRLSRLSTSDVQSASSVVFSLSPFLIMLFFWVPFFLSLISEDNQTDRWRCRTLPYISPSKELSPPLPHFLTVVASQQELFFFQGTSSECLPRLISLLINELPPHPASFHPSIFQTDAYILIYFCSILSLFQFMMARGAHPHPRCVFLGTLG